VTKDKDIGFRKKLEKVFYFFPFQLIILQLKRNYFLLFFWLVLFALVLDVIGSKYGISNLFLYPEYRDVNGPAAFAILGFSIGGYIISYNLYTYIIHSHRFPFIATLEKPLRKFAINNFILPITFLLVYFYNSYQFQHNNELVASLDIWLNFLCFILGMSFMIAFSFSYFYFTNRNVLYYTSKKKSKENQEKVEKEDSLAKGALQKPMDWQELEKRTDDWRVDSYLMTIFKIKIARSSKHYPREVLEKVLSQHHINASLFEVIVILSFVVVGLFREKPLFEIPAAASAILFFTILIMIFSAVYSWIKGWTVPVIISLMLIVNYGPGFSEFFNLETHAYGLNYQEKKVDYDAYLEDLKTNGLDVSESINSETQKLEKWSEKRGAEKPKLVLLSVSGGGLRSALWTMKSLLYADSTLNGNLLNQVHLITGSSGGMYGASYLREVFLRSDQNNRYSSEYLDNISKDILNPIILAMATHDLALRYRKTEIEGSKLLMDRAFAFETKLHSNTDNWLNKSLSDYTSLENNAQVPTIVFSPTINQDGRRLILSSGNMSLLCNAEKNRLTENLYFNDLFSENKPHNIRFSSVIRMNATFPYVLPATTLPTESYIKVSDSGLRDNFGLRLTLKYIQEMKKWISENTSGVVILEVRDTQRFRKVQQPAKRVLKEITAPLGGVYSNVIRTQEYDNELQFSLVKDTYGVPIHRVTFELERTENEQVSLSWHLTNYEKQTVLNGVKKPSFINSLNQLDSLISNQ